MNLYADYEGGNQRNGGSSFNPLLVAFDGATNGTANFYSASATFTPDMVGHIIAVDYPYIGYVYVDYYEIAARVDNNNITLRLPNGGGGGPALIDAAVNIPFRIGGRWRLQDGDYEDFDGIGPYDIVGPGDTLRIMATPSPVSIGNAQWTDESNLVTLSTPVAQDVALCTTAWTAANGSFSQTYSSVNRVGTSCAELDFPTTRVVNTKYFYLTLPATLDLSAWQRIALWIIAFETNALSLAGVTLCLCSDTLGNTIIRSAPLVSGKIYTGYKWTPHVVDFGVSLPTNVNSIAVYTGATLPTMRFFALNNMIAVKPAGHPLEFTFSHLIGKVHNSYWLPTNAYATNVIRKPTPPKRNGFRYQVTTAGTSGASEPVWPEVVGAAVTDGSVVWTCEGLEDTWYPCLSLVNGTEFRIDKATDREAEYVRLNKFFTETESVETFFRRPISVRGQRNGYSLSVGGSSAAQPAAISGGWNRVDMSTMTGETWYDMEDVLINGFILPYSAPYGYTENMNMVRAGLGFGIKTINYTLKNCHAIGNRYGFAYESRSSGCNVIGGVANNNSDGGGFAIGLQFPDRAIYGYVLWNRFRADNNTHNTYTYENQAGVVVGTGRHSYVWARQNTAYGVGLIGSGSNITIANLKTKFNTLNGVGPRQKDHPDTYLINAFVEEPVPFPAYTGNQSKVICQNFNGVAGYHVTYSSPAKMESDSGPDRHTLSGYAWKVTLPYLYEAAATRASPFSVPFNVAARTGIAVTLGVWVKRETLDSRAELVCVGGYVSGVPADVRSITTAAAGVYELLSVTVTPAEACVLPFELQIYRTVITAANTAVWFDDVSVT